MAGSLALNYAAAQTKAHPVDANPRVPRQAVSEGQEGSVPRLIRFNGNLSSRTNGPIGVEFALYRDQTGGVALWSEIQNVETDTAGEFTVMLGATQNGGVPPQSLGTGEERWLSITPLGGQAQPRVRLVSVPYALRAEEALRIAGTPASEFVRKTDLTSSVREVIRTIQPPAPGGQTTPAATSGPTTFSGNTANQIVLVQQAGSGGAIVAKAPSGTGTSSTGGSAGVVGTATTASGIGVQGLATSTAAGTNVGLSGIASGTRGYGITGQGAAIGVLGTSTDSSDVTGSDFGVQGIAHNSTGAGVQGNNLATSGTSVGVLGRSSSASGAGVQGIVNAPAGAGVWGINNATSGNAIGVTGNTPSTGPNAYGVNGFASAATGQVYGINGSTLSSGPFAAGVNGYEGSTTGQVYGISGFTNSAGSGSAGVNGGSGATSGVVYGVAGNAVSSTQNAAGVWGYQGAASGAVFGISGNSGSTGPFAAGVNGFESAATGQVFGVSGTTNSTGSFSAGVNGYEGALTGQVYGVNGGTASSTNGAAGVNGQSTAASGIVSGVFGSTNSANGNGVTGQANSTTGPSTGVTGSSASSSGYGVSGSSPNVALVGFNQSCNSSGCTLASGVGAQLYTSAAGTLLQGFTGPTFNALTTVFNIDGKGKGTFNGGVQAVMSLSSQPAIAGTNSGGGLAGSFTGPVSISGNLTVTGRITKGSGSFQIDHPLDPANKYLSHSFVESPDMMNIYNGVVTLDAHGAAWVTLPDYFDALNRDYRYQLTSIGKPQPRLYIASEISSRRFKIAGGKPGGRVSWMVTGIRQDAYANAYRIAVEENKPLQEQGHYLHPELFGGPAQAVSESR